MLLELDIDGCVIMPPLRSLTDALGIDLDDCPLPPKYHVVSRLAKRVRGLRRRLRAEAALSMNGLADTYAGTRGRVPDFVRAVSFHLALALGPSLAVRQQRAIRRAAVAALRPLHEQIRRQSVPAPDGICRAASAAAVAVRQLLGPQLDRACDDVVIRLCREESRFEAALFEYCGSLDRELLERCAGVSWVLSSELPGLWHYDRALPPLHHAARLMMLLLMFG